MFISYEEKEKMLNEYHKISRELLDDMALSNEEDLIPVWVWKKAIPQEIIDKKVFMKTGIDPKIYDDEKTFKSEFADKIEKKVESRLGIEEAHKADEKTGNSPVMATIHEKVSEYIKAKRAVVAEEYSAINNAFIEKHIGNKERKVLFNSIYTPVTIVEATVEEIKKYAKLDDVTCVLLYKEAKFTPSTNIAPKQIEVKDNSGNRNLPALTGAGIRIGIIESQNMSDQAIRYDPDATQLRFAPNLTYVPNPDTPNPVNDAHATFVTTVIVGQQILTGGQTFEGIVPQAQVYQTSLSNALPQTFELLTTGPYNVDILNCSFGNEGYYEYDAISRFIDFFIVSTGVSVVFSSGNIAVDHPNDHLTWSPAVAFNVITVGNLNTKSEWNTPESAPYSIFHLSRYGTVHDFYTNKPDIVAPGTNISYVNGVVLFDTGTSVAAPFVTGILAQCMQYGPFLRGKPSAAKSFLLHKARHNNTIISQTNNPAVENLTTLRRIKTGVGLVDGLNIQNACNIVRHGFQNTGELYYTPFFQLAANQTLRAVLTFMKCDNIDVINSDLTNDLDLALLNASGVTFASSPSNHQNIEILEYTPAASGQYRLRIRAHRIVAGTFAHAALCWGLT